MFCYKGMRFLSGVFAAFLFFTTKLANIGYRYELYCGSKANKSTQCTVHTEINRDTGWEFNNKREESKRYTRETYDALCMRYEEPDGKNRWDSPLFTIYPDGQLDLNAISDCLFEKKPPPPNQSTQNAPLSATNFLYELDRVTKEITDEILRAKRLGLSGEFNLAGSDGLRIDVTNVTAQRLMVLRRQYLNYSKMHTPETGKIPQLYVQFLKVSLASS